MISSEAQVGSDEQVAAERESDLSKVIGLVIRRTSLETSLVSGQANPGLFPPHHVLRGRPPPPPPHLSSAQSLLCSESTSPAFCGSQLQQETEMRGKGKEAGNSPAGGGGQGRGGGQGL